MANVEDTREFTVNLVAQASSEAMNISSMDFPRGVDEFIAASVAHEPGELVKTRRVTESPISLECIYHQSIQLPVPKDSNLINRMVIGQVVGVHVSPLVLTPDNRIDTNKLNLIARLGYNSFVKVSADFEMKRPELGLFKNATKLAKADVKEEATITPNI